MMLILPLSLNVQVHPGSVAETLEKMEKHLGRHIAHLLTMKLSLPNQPRPAAEIKRHLTQAVIHRQDKAIPANAALVTKTTKQAFAQRKGCVLHRMVFVDFKIADRATSLEATGIDPVVRDANVRAVMAAGGRVVARMPVIPGFTDSAACVDANVKRICELGITQVDVLPFHQLGQAKYDSLGRAYGMRDVPQLADSDVAGVVARCEAAGLRAVVHGE